MLKNLLCADKHGCRAFGTFSRQDARSQGEHVTGGQATQRLTGETLHHVRRDRNVRIPMPDGVTLAADVFRPDTPGRYPVVLEYLPYRKNDTTRQGYYGHRYFAERGYVAVRLDVRGTGDSEGTALDEYCPQEQLDGVAAIAWLAEQPWSTGAVGMFGTSYGGFNSLQVAMHRPPALKAICPMYFTDNRYTDDCHYKGGALQMLYDVGTYGLSMVGRNLLPPRPDLVGERWAAIWEEHLRNEPWLLRWLAHPTLDEQWRQGSLCENYRAITCATFLLGGWRDGYTNCNLRTFEHLNCPKKLLIGPWLHARPHEGLPGPRINHHREMARFYDYWLKGIDNGVMDEPPIALYVQQYDPPQSDRPLTSGFWRYETEWPLARGREESLGLDHGVLRADGPDQDAGVDTLSYHPAVGTTFGIFSAGGPYVLPADQRIEEAFSAVYTGPVLAEPLEILGRPRVVLWVDSDAKVVTFVARLCDVAPDGSSALITKGVLNATHRASDSEPSPLVPGEVYELTIDLDATSWQFEPGHRLRLSVSNADFPNTWPSPEPATSRVHLGGDRPSRLLLPVAGPAPASLPAPEFEPSPFPLDAEHPAPRQTWRVTRDQMRGHTELTIESGGTVEIDDGYIQDATSTATAGVDERNPAHAWMHGRQSVRYRWPGQTIALRSQGQITSTPDAFHVTLHVALDVDDMPHFSRQWTESFPRNLL
jgi:putative CocE/NonD family hydrolase